MKIKKFMFVVALLLFAGAVSGVKEYQDTWGPDVGTEVPDLTVKDTEGNDRSIDDLRGENKGLLIFFVRTSDW